MLRVFGYRSKIRSVNFHLIEDMRTKIFQSVRCLSYLHMCGKHSLRYKTVGKVFEDAAQNYGDREAFVSCYQNQRITFSEANTMAAELAAGILALGIEKGDRVALWAPNSIEWYITSFALAKAGIISVYINPSFQALEILHCLNAVGVKMLFLTETFKSQNFMRILEEIIPELANSKPGELKSAKVPTLKSVVCISEKEIPGMIPYQQIPERATENSRKKLKDIQKLISPDDASNIQFTSGTTGSPKGAVTSHFHIVNNSFFSAKRQELEAQVTNFIQGCGFGVRKLSAPGSAASDD